MSRTEYVLALGQLFAGIVLVYGAAFAMFYFDSAFRGGPTVRAFFWLVAAAVMAVTGVALFLNA